MSQKFNKLVNLLKELFQLDQPDLDFGLYRIMHAKAGEITQFLEKDLLPQVKTAFGQYQTADKAELEKKLAKVIAGVEAAGLNPEEAPKVQELRVKLADEAIDVEGLENEVYDHLFSFFRRYYSEGDFLAKRVYKPGVYAIPYEGEEVKLHWANQDQYYIKTSEYLRDYAFRLKPHDESNPMRVHFRLVDATEGEHGNVKATNGDRVFILAPGGEGGHDFVAEEDGELAIRFEYRPASMEDWTEAARDSATAAAKKKPPVQGVLLAQAAEAILGVTADPIAKWVTELAKPHVKTDGETAEYSRLEAHLRRYSARNTFDYFIHKDLGGFLRRELDFYIKNEIMHLDDIEHDTVPRVEQYLSKIKVIRKIAGKVIDFLAQLEDFQKTLWLKKKFVVETNYCITLDRIPEEFYPEIAANEAQREEWVRLLSIDRSQGNTLGQTSYSVPLTEDFLHSHPYLPVDTALFDDATKSRILASFDDIDAQMSGLLVHSENYQAVRLLQRKYQRQVRCIYIDPPYNSPSSEIAYKNNYKHGSWLSLMHDRMDEASLLSTADGSCVIAIDENEHNGIERLCMELYSECDITTVAIEHNRKGIQGSHFSYTNEFAVFVIPPELRALNKAQLPEDEWEYANLRNWGGESLRSDGRNCFYPIYINGESIVGFGDVCADDFHPASANVKLENGRIAIYPVDAEGVERKWRYARDTVEGIKQLLKVEQGRSGDLQVKKAKADSQFKTMWYAPKYNAGDYGTKILTNMGFHKGLFDFPKSSSLINPFISPHSTLHGH